MLNTRIGPYTILQKLGHGGFGQVFKAKHHYLGRLDAVKVLLNSEHLRSLKREGRALAKLKHPNIIEIYNLDLEHDPPYIAMEYFEGQDFRHKLQENCSIDEIVNVGLGAAKAMRHAHSNGVVHRDFHPGNILVGDNVKICDFGLASLPTSVMEDYMRNSQGSAVPLSQDELLKLGFKSYMAPERFHSEGGPRSDLYSLAVVLLYALEGRLPATFLFDYKLSDKAKRKASPGLVHLVEKNLQSNPDSRSLSVEDFVGVFEQIQNPMVVVGEGYTSTKEISKSATLDGLRVYPGQRVVVKPGCKLSLTGPIQVDKGGCFTALGENNPFGQTSVDGNYNKFHCLGEMEFSYCDIMRMSDILIDGGLVTIVNSNLQDVQEGIRIINESGVTFNQSCLFFKSPPLVTLALWYIRNSKLSVLGSRIEGTGWTRGFLVASDGQLDMRKSHVYHCGELIPKMVRDSQTSPKRYVQGGYYIGEDYKITEGGGFYFDGGKATITDSLIEHNGAIFSGGGIFVEHGGVIMKDCIVRENMSESSPGICIVNGAVSFNGILKGNKSFVMAGDRYRRANIPSLGVESGGRFTDASTFSQKYLAFLNWVCEDAKNMKRFTPFNA